MSRTIEVSEETYETIKDQLAEDNEAREGESFQIAVLSHGFVYVGYCLLKDGLLTVRKARNIRKWGTTNGLGELSLDGPLSGTVLDRCRDITARAESLVHLIDCNELQWK